MHGMLLQGFLAQGTVKNKKNTIFIDSYNPLYSDGYSYIHIKAIRMGLSIIYLDDYRLARPNYNAFSSLRIVFTLTNSGDPNEMLHFIRMFNFCQSTHLGVSVMETWYFTQPLRSINKSWRMLNAEQHDWFLNCVY